MSRRPDWIPARKAFPTAVIKAAKLRSGGVCEKLGCEGVAAEFDHGIPVAIGGASDLVNCFHLCVECHQKKTALDVKLIAKADRVGGRSGQQARRAKAKAAGKHRAIAGPKVSALSKNNPGYIKPKWQTKRKERG